MSENTQKKPSVFDMIIAFEEGTLQSNETLELFSELIKTGLAWTLQGMYGRQAMEFIESGFLDKQGNILRRFGEDEG
jgi:hypothetical protein